MDDLQKIILQRLAEDDKLMETIRVELLTSLDYRKPKLELDNEKLGAEVRAIERAKEYINEGLKNISKLKSSKKVGNQESNPGR